MTVTDVLRAAAPMGGSLPREANGRWYHLTRPGAKGPVARMQPSTRHLSQGYTSAEAHCDGRGSVHASTHQTYGYACSA